MSSKTRGSLSSLEPVLRHSASADRRNSSTSIPPDLMTVEPRILNDANRGLSLSCSHPVIRSKSSEDSKIERNESLSRLLMINSTARSQSATAWETERHHEPLISSPSVDVRRLHVTTSTCQSVELEKCEHSLTV